MGKKKEKLPEWFLPIYKRRRKHVIRLLRKSETFDMLPRETRILMIDEEEKIYPLDDFAPPSPDGESYGD